MGRFTWKRSAVPESVETWQAESNLGYNATYACLTHTPEGCDVIVYRGGEVPCSVMFQRQREKGAWTTAREIFCQDIVPQYTHNGAWIATDHAGNLYVSAHFYNTGGMRDPVKSPKEFMRSYGVAILKSTDAGQSWRQLDGTPVTLPAVYTHALAVPPLDGDVRNYGVVCDSRGGVWVLTGDCTGVTRTLLLNQWTDRGWVSLDLSARLPADWCPIDAALTVDTRDRLHVACTCVPDAQRGERLWGNRYAEILHLRLDPATGHCDATPVTLHDPALAHWLPNISHSGPFQPVEHPVILYTRGVPGEGCKPPDQTEVWCARMVENA